MTFKEYQNKLSLCLLYKAGLKRQRGQVRGKYLPWGQLGIVAMLQIILIYCAIWLGSSLDQGLAFKGHYSIIDRTLETKTLSSASPHSIFVTLDCELYLCNREICSSNVMSKCHNQLKEFCKKHRVFRKCVLKEMEKNCMNGQWLFYVTLVLS